MVTTTKTPTSADLAKQVDDLKADLAKLTETMVGMGRAKADETAQGVSAQADLAKAQARAAALRANDEFTHLTNVATKSVHDRPMAALAVAAGIGLAVGLLSGRR